MMKLRNPDIDKYINDFNKYKEIKYILLTNYKSCGILTIIYCDFVVMLNSCF